MRAKVTIPIMVVLLAIVQYNLWFGNNGYLHMQQLHKQVLEEKEKIGLLAARNKSLILEVKDLKSGSNAVETIARNDLTMIKKGEVFYHTVTRK
jgi:cell division protein FtsB